MNRRELLTKIGAGFGMVGLESLLRAEDGGDPLAPKAPTSLPRPSA